MRVGYWFALMLSFVLAAVFALTAAGLFPYRIAGQAVSRDAWWRISPVLPVVSAIAAAIAFGIRRRKRWVRHLVMLLWLTLALSALASYVRGDIPRPVTVRALIEPAVLTAICGWYFYARPNVVEYFRSIGNETSSR
jgi:hypothetical protein